MGRFALVLFMLLVPLGIGAQRPPEVDGNYREDQFYLGAAYNFLMKRPHGVIQDNFSYNFSGGFIRDIPLNQGRNIGLGVGVGYSFRTYYTNIRATEGAGIGYSIIPTDSDAKRSKIGNHVLEFPIQFRWRTSNPTNYKFWRIYAGIRFDYVFDSWSKYVSASERNVFWNGDIRRWQYGPTLDIGYNTVNIHFFYGLTGLFKDNVLLGAEAIEMAPMSVGITFYIL